MTSLDYIKNELSGAYEWHKQHNLPGKHGKIIQDKARSCKFGNHIEQIFNDILEQLTYLIDNDSRSQSINPEVAYEIT